MKNIISIILVCSGILLSCSKNNQIDHTGTLGSIIQIDLASNPSTGYCWEWTNSDSITVVDSISWSFKPDLPNRKGSPGIEIWEFIGIKQGSEILKFQYCKAWDPNYIVDSKEIKVTIE